MRAVGYIRVSTRRQANEGVSLDVQRDQIMAFARESGWVLGELYVDRGASARDDGRPQFQRLLADALSKPAPFDTIIVYDRSRFFRNAAQSELTIRNLRRNGVSVNSVTQPNGTDAAGDMIRQIIAAVDEHASAENAKRVSGTMIENARQGYRNGAVAPYGYATVVVEQKGKKEKKKLEIDEVEAAVVERIFQLAEVGHERSGSMGVKAIVEHLNKRGYRTRRGKLWHIGPMHKLLTNPVYRGEYIYNTTNSATKMPRPSDEHVRVSCPAIISEAQFQAVQDLLRSRNPKIAPPRVLTGPILLTGLLTCGKCGSAMTMRTGKSGQYRYYACANRQARGKEACEGCSHPMDRIDHAVTRAMADRLFTSERLASMIETIESDRRSATEDRSELLRLESELADARTRVGRLMELVEHGLAQVTEPEFAVRLTAAQRDRDIALAGVERVKRRTESWETISTERIVAFARYMHDRVCNGEVPFRKHYLRATIANVLVEDDALTITGPKDLLKALVKTGKYEAGQVPTAIHEWRARKDSNL